MSVDEQKALKAEVLAALDGRIALYKDKLQAVDGRLWDYIDGLVHSKTDVHCLWEVLGVRKFLRLLDTYEFCVEKVQRFVKMYEMLELPGLQGRQRYRLTPVQVFQFASMLGFYEGARRVVRQVIWFVPRKFSKTTGVGALALHELLYGDANCEVYMAANSSDQSGRCFKVVKGLVQQLDPQGRMFRVTESEVSWRLPNKHGKEGLVQKLTAGGKNKDGLAASLVLFDEYAASRYVRGHCDGAELLNVLTSSMGTRLNPMTVITTTASRVKEGPFEVLLDDAKQALIDDELDWQFASIFEPDAWEKDDPDSLASERVWRKCNPHIGVTVQPDYYEKEWDEALRNDEKMKEFMCKLLNVFQTDKVRDWLDVGLMKSLRVKTKVDDFSPSDKWLCFVGMDFSRGDDLNCQAYLCWHPKYKVWYLDCDAWISESILNNHTNGVLYRRWVEQGWLRVSPGETINEMLVVERMAEVFECVNIVRLGYDPYDAKRFLNALSAWVESEGGEPKRFIRPVRQTWGTFNSAVQNFEYMCKTKLDGPVDCLPGATRLLSISENPIIPWCFGNAVLEEDKYENVKPIKRTQAGKIDVAICALEGVILQDEWDGES